MSPSKGTRTASSAIERALIQEAYLASSLLNGGVTAMRKASSADPGRMYEALFGLSNGVERLGKLIVVADHFARMGAYPDPVTVKKCYSHDLTKLLQAIESIAASRNVDLADAPKNDKSTAAVVEFLKKFASTDRYYNINRLAQGDGTTIADPVVGWIRLVETHAPRHRTSPKRADREKLERSMSRALDGMVPAAILNFEALDGGRISSFEGIMAQTHVDQRISVEGMLLAIRPLRFLARTITTLDYVRGLPVLSEFFWEWMVPDSALRRRRQFPRRR